jgi:hypothetical protein
MCYRDPLLMMELVQCSLTRIQYMEALKSMKEQKACLEVVIIWVKINQQLPIQMTKISSVKHILVNLLMVYYNIKLISI